MGSKTSGNCNCCCSDCSPSFPNSFKSCCLCLCKDLCVTISTSTPTQLTSCASSCLDQTGTIGYCLCTESSNTISWSEALCAWNGTAQCGSLAIDLKVEIIESGGSCYWKINSTCLGLSDQLYAFTGCTDYVRRCGDRGEPFTLSLSAVDASSCNDGDCTSVDIDITCYPYVNPDLVDMKCKNCDCVCNCLCITYEEDGCSETKRACWNGSGWSATFDGNCSWSPQTVGISFQEGPNRCCVLNATVSRGTLDADDQTATCPDINSTWTGGFTSGTGSSSFSIGAACESSCSGCTVDSDCCSNVPLTIYLVVCEDNCGQTNCFPLTLVSATAEEVSWRGTGSASCSDGGDPDPSSTCEPFVFDVELVCVDNGMGGDDWYARYYCNDTLIQENLLSGVTCEPICATDTNAVEIFGNACNPSIACAGTTVRFDFVQDCRPLASSQRTVYEQPIITDPVVIQVATYPYIVESFSVNDSVGILIQLNNFATTESFTLNDAVTFLIIYPISLTESFTLQDSVTLSAASGMSVVESFTLNDVVTINVSVSNEVVESFTLQDTVAIVATASDELVESFTLQDTVTFETTPFSCSTTCLMEWDEGLAEWVVLTDNCEASCRCPTAAEAEAELGPGSMAGEQQNATCIPT